MVVVLVERLALFVLAASIAIIAVPSASASDQFAARSEILIFIVVSFARNRLTEAATGGWLLVKTTRSEPVCTRKKPPPRSLLKEELSSVNLFVAKLVTLPAV